MSPPPRPARWSAARAAAQRRLEAARARLQEAARQRAADPRLVARRTRRRRRAGVALATLALLAVLLLVLRRCACIEPPPPPVAELTCPAAPECPSRPAQQPRRPTSRDVRPKPLPRDALAVAPTRTPKWLSQFRLQVTARSLELAACFNGVEKPGALRWTTTVTPRPGTVADSEWEPALRGPPLTTSQQACVERSLRGPYRLVPDGDDDVGTRVSLVLEF